METTWWTQPEELDARQTEVVALPMAGNHLVIGPPGSGKTNLLILRASYLYGAGLHNISILTFGRVLREFLASGAINYNFPASRIQTYNKWATGIITENGGEIDTSGSFENVRDKLKDGLEAIAALGDHSNTLDCILIDEAQDYTADEIKIIEKFAKQIFVVGDNRQRIYQSSGSIDYLSKTADSVKELPHHYRNGRKICRVADGIRNEINADEGMESTSNYNETEYPSTVLHLGGEHLKMQIESAIAEIETQLRAYPDGMIGVLCPRHEELESVATELQNSKLADYVQVQKYADGYVPFEAGRRIIVTTIHGAKGLEFRALHLLGMEKVANFRKVQRNLAYTAVTRAKTSLAIYHDGALPGYLENGIRAATNDVVSPPKIADLFKRGT
jgi:superfamily I DNA/RNA helicase